MNKWFLIFLLVFHLGGCKPNKSLQKDTSKDLSLEIVSIGEDDLKKFIRNHPVILWKMEELKKETESQDFHAKINNFAKELGYKSIDEFNHIWMVLATIQVQLNYKKELENKLEHPDTSKEQKKLLLDEIKITNEFLKYGFVREDLPRVDTKLIEKYYKELEKLKITNLIEIDGS